MNESFIRPVSLPLDAVTQRFLLLCLRSFWRPDSQDQTADMARQEEIQWEALCQTAGHVGVAPLLYICVRDRALLPSAFEQTLERAYQQSAMSNAVLSVELNRLLKLLAEASLPAIVLKGAALGDTLYGDSALRPMTDIDLLLHPWDVVCALDLLQARGYTWRAVEPRAGLRLDFENELLLRAPGPTLLPIELHWHLIDSPYYQRQVDETWFWQTAQWVVVADTQALVLGLEANLLYLSAHYVLHHRAQGLRWLVDIVALISSQPAQIDWSLLLAQAQAFHLVRSIQIVLRQLTGEWQAPIPLAVLEDAKLLPVSPEERQVVARLLAERRPALSRFWADLAAMSDWRLRLRYGTAQVFPSLAYMKDRYRPVHPWLLPLTYPHRWGLGIKGLAASRLSGAEGNDSS